MWVFFNKLLGKINSSKNYEGIVYNFHSPTQ